MRGTSTLILSRDRQGAVVKYHAYTTVARPEVIIGNVNALDRAQRELDEQRWVENLIAEAKAEEAANPMSIEEMLMENERLTRYGERQAKKLGIKPRDIDRLIHESRRERRS